MTRQGKIMRRFAIWGVIGLGVHALMFVMYMLSNPPKCNPLPPALDTIMAVAAFSFGIILATLGAFCALTFYPLKEEMEPESESSAAVGGTLR